MNTKRLVLPCRVSSPWARRPAQRNRTTPTTLDHRRTCLSQFMASLYISRIYYIIGVKALFNDWSRALIGGNVSRGPIKIRNAYMTANRRAVFFFRPIRRPETVAKWDVGTPLFEHNSSNHPKSAHHETHPRISRDTPPRAPRTGSTRVRMHAVSVEVAV